MNTQKKKYSRIKYNLKTTIVMIKQFPLLFSGINRLNYLKKIFLLNFLKLEIRIRTHTGKNFILYIKISFKSFKNSQVCIIDLNKYE